MTQYNRKGALYLVAAAVCFSFGGLCIKLIPWGAMSIIGIRSLLAVFVFAAWRKSVRIEFTKGNILAALSLSATTVLFVFANKMTTAASAIFLQFSAPIFIVLIQLIFFGKKPRISDIAAMSATFLGMLLFFAGNIEGGALPGNILAILSGVTFAAVFVLNGRPDVNSEQSMMLGFIINTALGLPFAFFDVTTEPLAWACVVFLGIVQVGIAYAFLSIGIKYTPALLACLTTAIEPVLNPVWVALATGEVPGINVVAGGVVIILTVVCYNVWTARQTAEE